MPTDPRPDLASAMWPSLTKEAKQREAAQTREAKQREADQALWVACCKRSRDNFLRTLRADRERER
jgi:hypothetical protein